MEDKNKQWAQCQVCGEEMEPGGQCGVSHCADDNDVEYERIPYGKETRYNDLDLPEELKENPPHCHDCNVALGAYHHCDCDWEECPLCHHQMLSCDHMTEWRIKR